MKADHDMHCALPPDLATMSDETFLAFWIDTVGERPAIMLDRAEMIRILTISLRKSGPPHDLAVPRRWAA